SFLIEEVENREHAVVFQMVDEFLTIHKDALKVEITRDIFPDAPDDSIGKYLPLSVGMIPESELVEMSSQAEVMPLYTTFDQAKTAALVVDTSPDSVWINPGTNKIIVLGTQGVAL